MSDALELTGNTADQLKQIYAQCPQYHAKIEDKHLLTGHFLRQYHASLFYYKHFYDDTCVYGDPDSCTDAFYFVCGFNGSPGQIKFGVPSIVKRYGRDVYIKSLYVEEFSCHHPSWIKYTSHHLEKRRQTMVRDLVEMTNRFPRVRVIVSSTGFYEFLAVYPELLELKHKLILYWVSCAPDQVSRSIWQSYFYGFNGFSYRGMKWFSYPNHQLLRLFNPECATRKNWKHDQQKNTFYKIGLESRFFCFGLLWDYASWDCITFFLDNNLSIYRKSGLQIDIETHVLAGTRDGFWDDSRPEVIEKTLDKYIREKRVIYKQSSHLWVVTPENISELIV